MTDEVKIFQLIVRQIPAASGELLPLLQKLQKEYGLESYTARQRLTGQGLAMFGKGSEKKTQQLADLLQTHGFACWVVEKLNPSFAPDRLRSLEIRNTHIDFACQGSSHRLEKGSRVVAVLADISGELSTRMVKRMINQKTYRGHVPTERPSLQQTLKSLYLGRPVLDFYLFNQQAVTTGAVRAYPGKFNHTGLGERACMSANLNLEALRLLVEEYAGDYSLHTDFGLGYMPDCALDNITETTRTTSRRPGYGSASAGTVEVETVTRENLTALGDNLKSLTRYGWLVMQLQGDGRPASPARGDAAVGVAAAVALGRPILGATIASSQGADVLPEMTEVAEEINTAINDVPGETADTGEHTTSSQHDLPVPPDRPPQQISLGRSIMTFGGIFGAVVIAFKSGGGELLGMVFRHGMTAGVVPAIVAMILLWSGFFCVRMKRRVENTPTSRVRSMAMGMVELHGQTRRIYALVAPMTQSACAWYRLRKYRKDKNDHWKLISEINSNHVPFQLDDGTGRVTVDPDGASIKAKIRQTGYPGQPALTFKAFGSSYGEDEKWVEDIIYEGTSLYVLGYAQPLREEKMTLRQRTMEKLRQLKLDPQALRRYDVNGDGSIDQEEWEMARSDAEQAALRESLDQQGERKHQEQHAVIARPPQRGLPYLIAEAQSETQLSNRYGWFSVPLLLGGAGFLSFAVYKLLQYLNI